VHSIGRRIPVHPGGPPGYARNIPLTIFEKDAIVRKWRLCLAAFAALCASAPAASAQSPATPASVQIGDAVDASAQPWLVWHTDDFFTTCDGNCSVAVYGGREITTNMTQVFLLRQPVAPWRWGVGDAGIVAGEVSRRFATLFGGLDLEAILGVGQRYGDMHATEMWTGVDIRWTVFPWNNYVKTTIAVADGLDYATGIDPAEVALSGNNKHSSFLNFFAPELTLALPSHPDDELLLRFHHRSGIFGLINGVDTGAQFGTIGFRHRF
jgi:hypothetical protein